VTCVSINHLDLSWPPIFTAIAQFFEIFKFSLPLLRPSCLSVGISPFAEYAIAMSMPIVVLLVFALLYGLSWVWRAILTATVGSGKSNGSAYTDIVNHHHHCHSPPAITVHCVAEHEDDDQGNHVRGGAKSPPLSPNLSDTETLESHLHQHHHGHSSSNANGQLESPYLTVDDDNSLQHHHHTNGSTTVMAPPWLLARRGSTIVDHTLTQDNPDENNNDSYTYTDHVKHTPNFGPSQQQQQQQQHKAAELPAASTANKGIHCRWAIGKRIGELLLSPPLCMNRMVNSVGAIWQTLYISLAANSFLVFQCYSHPVGSSSLTAFPSVICGSKQWYRMMPVGLFGIVVYVLGFFALMTYLILLSYTPHRHGTTEGFETRWRFLFGNWKPSRRWWALVFLLREMVVALVPVLLPNDAYLQLSVVVMLMLCVLTFQLLMQPWQNIFNNVLDASIMAAFILIGMHATFFSPREDKDAKYFATVLVVSCGVAFSIWASVMTLNVTGFFNSTDCGRSQHRKIRRSKVVAALRRILERIAGPPSLQSSSFLPPLDGKDRDNDTNTNGQSMYLLSDDVWLPFERRLSPDDVAILRVAIHLLHKKLIRQSSSLSLSLNHNRSSTTVLPSFHSSGFLDTRNSSMSFSWAVKRMQPHIRRARSRVDLTIEDGDTTTCATHEQQRHHGGEKKHHHHQQQQQREVPAGFRRASSTLPVSLAREPEDTDESGCGSDDVASEGLAVSNAPAAHRPPPPRPHPRGEDCLSDTGEYEREWREAVSCVLGVR